MMSKSYLFYFLCFRKEGRRFVLVGYAWFTYDEVQGLREDQTSQHFQFSSDQWVDCGG
jgi:hypothetical protein